MAALLLGSGLLQADGDASDSFMVRHSVESDFDAVKDNLRWAIEGQGLVITAEAHIDEMLKRTGRDLGIDGDVYGHAVAFEFCSAKFSRQMMAADPHNIVFCPFVISVYNLPADPDTVFVAYRRPERVTGSEESRSALDAVGDLLEVIAQEAIE
jgi:uncharacterized protein (DUF302 family)